MKFYFHYRHINTTACIIEKKFPSYPTIEEINREELNDVNNEVLMPFGSRLFRITAAVDEHPTTG